MVDEIYTAEFEDTGLPTLGWFGCYLAWETAEGEKKIKLLGIIGCWWGWGWVEGSKPIEYYEKSFLLLQPYPRATKHCISEEACFWSC